MKRKIFLFLPMVIYGLSVKFFLSLLVIFFSFFGPGKDEFFVYFQEWIYEYNLFIVLFAKFFILVLFFQFSIRDGQHHAFELSSYRWQNLLKGLQFIKPRTSVITWPVFYLLVFSVYFIIYPISFKNQNLVNWDDALSSYFYVSIYLFMSIFSGHMIIYREQRTYHWPDFLIMGLIMALIDWFSFPLRDHVFSILWCFYALTFMHLWRQKNIQLFFFTFFFFSFLLVFFAPIHLFSMFPTEVWNINVQFHPLPFILPFALLYVLFQFSLKLTRKIFPD
jgi:hypothetical protein